MFKPKLSARRQHRHPACNNTDLTIITILRRKLERRLCAIYHTGLNIDNSPYPYRQDVSATGAVTNIGIFFERSRFKKYTLFTTHSDYFHYQKETKNA